MLVLVLAAIVLFALTVGATVFLLALILPVTRPYALSAALWCAVWGPSFCAWIMMGIAGLVATSFTDAKHLTRVPTTDHLFIAFAILSTAIVASILAWLHQALIRRFTFPLFRLYATLVSAGIGSVFGWALALWGLFREPISPALWLPAILLLVIGFGTAAYKGARFLRGAPPTRLTWITPEEYAEPNAVR